MFEYIIQAKAPVELNAENYFPSGFFFLFLLTLNEYLSPRRTKLFMNEIGLLLLERVLNKCYMFS